MFFAISYFRERAFIMRNPLDRVKIKASKGLIGVLNFQWLEFAIVSSFTVIFSFLVSLFFDERILNAAVKHDLLELSEKVDISSAIGWHSLIFGFLIFPCVIFCQLISSFFVGRYTFRNYSETFKQFMVVNSCIGIFPSIFFSMYWIIVSKLIFFNQIFGVSELFQFGIEYEKWPKEISSVASSFINFPPISLVLWFGITGAIIFLYQLILEIPSLMMKIQGVYSLGRKVVCYTCNAVVIVFLLQVILILFYEFSKVYAFVMVDLIKEITG